jgi:hypothetical protein
VHIMSCGSRWAALTQSLLTVCCDEQGSIGSRDKVPLLVECLQAEDAGVADRTSAIQCLRNICRPAANSSLVGSTDVVSALLDVFSNPAELGSSQYFALQALRSCAQNDPAQCAKKLCERREHAFAQIVSAAVSFRVLRLAETGQSLSLHMEATRLLAQLARSSHTHFLTTMVALAGYAPIFELLGGSKHAVLRAECAAAALALTPLLASSWSDVSDCNKVLVRSTIERLVGDSEADVAAIAVQCVGMLASR